MHFMSVYKLVQTGRLPAVKLGSRWKIDPAELEQFVGRHRQVRHRWVLVGSSSRRVESLRDALGAGHQLWAIGFAGLSDAIEAEPEVVLIDPTADRQAALAALGLCRQQSEPPFTVLLVPPDEPALVADALQDGLVTLVSLTAADQLAEQIETVLHWR